MKKCIKCKKELDETMFHKNKTKKDGLTNICKSCIADYNKIWVNKNKDRVNKNQRLLKKKHTDNGLCMYCNNKSLPNNTMCEKHWFQNVSRNHFKTSKYWKTLMNIWLKQNKKCVYTDEILIPAENMSLDHIISKFNDKTLSHELKNVQWVTKDINIIKNKLSHNQFIKLCEKIYKKYSNNITTEIKACGDNGLLLSVKQEAPYPLGSE